jgi:putative peptide zinc metalloprotease protein
MPNIRPTFSESWYRVADLKAKLRPSAQITRQYYRGDRWYVVRDPAGNQYHRLSAPAYRFVGLLDGTRTVSQAWDLVGGQLADDAPTQNEVIQILSQLTSANLLESNVTPDAAVLLRRHKKQVKQKWQGRLMNILFPRIPLWDPDRFLVRWMPVMRNLLSLWFGVVWLAVVIAACVVIAPRWKELQSAASTAIEPYNWPFLWASFVLIKLIHELGHGFFCRRFGGEVHELGIMFLVLVPAPYVDASSAWSFQNKWHKVLVGAGGMIFELFVAALAAFVWANTQASYSFWGIPVNGLAYNIMLIASVSTVIFNANPLLRYDGYYILSDLLEIPNLRYRSTEYSLGLIKRHLFGVKLMQPLPPVGQRFWLFIYAIASGIYRTFVGIAIILMVWNKVPILGVLMAAGGLATWLIVPVFKTLKYLMLEPELHRKRTRAWAWTLAMGCAVLGILWVPKMPRPLYAEGIVEPAQRQSLHTRTPGKVVKILKTDGEIVKAGEPIIILEDKQLESEIARVNFEIDSLLVQERAYGNNPAERERVRDQLVARQTDKDAKLKRWEDLTVKSPIAGKLIAPNLRDSYGMFLPQGTEVAVVSEDRELRIVALIDQDDAALSYSDLQLGLPAEIRMASEVWRKDVKATIEAFAGGDKRRPTPFMELPEGMEGLDAKAGGKVAMDATDPHSRKLQRPQIGMWLDLSNDNLNYLPGQRCYVRFELEKQSWGIQWYRRVRQLIQSHSSQNKWI